jgi:hypothetical protein
LLAQRPQWLLAPGTGVHRHHHQQAGKRRPRLPSARRELPAVGVRSLLAQPQLREPHRHRQAAPVAMARPRGRPRALRPRGVGVGLGVERPGRSRRGARLRGRRADAGDAGRCVSCARTRPSSPCAS